MYLKESELEYLKIDKVKTVIKQYTEFINYPIELWESKEVEREVPVEEEEDSDEGDSDGVEGDSPSDEPKIEEVEEEKEEKTQAPKLRKLKKRYQSEGK